LLRLVLRDNTFQTQSLAVSGAMAPGLLDSQERFMRALERSGKLNRALEFLPSDEEIAERRAAKRGLTSPEAAVLLAYSKIALYDELLASDVPDEPLHRNRDRALFPAAAARAVPQLHRQPSAAARNHRDARHQQHGEPRRQHVRRSPAGGDRAHRAPDVVRAYIVAREVFGSSISGARSRRSRQGRRQLANRMVIGRGRPDRARNAWLLCATAPISPTSGRRSSGSSPALSRSRKRCRTGLPKASETRRGRRRRSSTRRASPKRCCGASRSSIRCSRRSISSSRRRAQVRSDVVARLYFALGGRLEFPWMRSRIDRLAATSHWHTLAKAALRDDLASIQRQLTAVALRAAPNERDPARLAALWEAAHKSLLEPLRPGARDLRTDRGRRISRCSRSRCASCAISRPRSVR
jgi:glutamate dehydrogenase